MRTRLATLAILAAATAAFSQPVAAGQQYERECSGTVDSMCYHDFCGIADCTRSDCVAYSGVFGDGNAGICAGTARPGDPES